MPPKARAVKKDELSMRSTKSNSLKEQPSKKPSAPNWPPLIPLVPASDLSLTTLLPDQILTIPRLWTVSLCKIYVKFLSTLPLTTTPGKPKKGDAVRVNDRFQVEDPDFAEMLWTGTALKDMVEAPVVEGRELDEVEKRELWGGEVLGLNSNIRIYRYVKGQFFDQHCRSNYVQMVRRVITVADVHLDDDSNTLTFPSSPAAPSGTPARTTWTLLLYLSSPATGCVGGETMFYPDPPTKRDAAPPPIIAELEVGTALLHRHGKDCLLHEGREVTAGEKWVVRSDLCVKR